VSSSAGNFTINATGGSSLSGVTGYVPHFNSTTTIDTTGLFWGNGSRLGIGTVAPGASLQINGEGITSGTSSLLINNSTPSELFRVANNGLISIGKNVSVSTQSSSQIQAVSGDANTSIVFTPKGTGAFILGPAPNSAISGGNARGQYAVDLQMARNSSIGRVASGNYSFLAGYDNIASGTYSTAIGFNNQATGDRSCTIGLSNLASGVASIAFGGQATASGEASFAMGGNGDYNAYGSVASAAYSFAHGRKSRAYMIGQFAKSGWGFADFNIGGGNAQSSLITMLREITGTLKSELFLDGGFGGSSTRAVLALVGGATNARAWNAEVKIIAICNSAGSGTLTVGDCFVSNYVVGIKRVGSSTSLIGSLQQIGSSQYNSSMASSVVDITADDTFDCLKIEFTPPSTAASNTIIRVVASVSLSEIGY
jgi:hypothetical protein